MFSVQCMDGRVSIMCSAVVFLLCADSAVVFCIMCSAGGFLLCLVL